MNDGFAFLVMAFARRVLGGADPINNLSQLTGGANMESWSFDYAGQGYVLRRSPTVELMAGRTYGHDVEAAVVRAAFAAGVKAPEIVGEIEPGDDLGTGYLMRRVEAEVNPARILAQPKFAILDDFARELAAIHAVSLATLPELPETTAGTLLDDLKFRFVSFGGDRPVMAMAFKWLQDHLLPPVEAVLLHGDFRMGNIMVDPKGLAAVLDWELAHLGDRHQDLAYGCINSWRFGHIDRPAFGVGQLDTFFAAYERETGLVIEPERFRWWLVYATLWWGVCCLQMADIWRNGQDAGLERAVIGRRASETEVDLLMLLENDAPVEEQQCRLDFEAGSRSSSPKMADASQNTGEPSATELLHALGNWIATEIKPHATGRERFMAAVAMNAIGILKREAETPIEFHDKALADDLLSGRKSLSTPGLVAQLKSISLQKLAADQPKYSALAVARQKWSR